MAQPLLLEWQRPIVVGTVCGLSAAVAASYPGAGSGEIALGAAIAGGLAAGLLNRNARLGLAAFLLMVPTLWFVLEVMR